MTRKSIFLCAAMVLVIGLFPAFGHGAPAKEEVLKIAVSLEQFNIDLSQYAVAADRVVGDNWAEELLYRAPSGDITPGLVESWKMAPDGKKLECTLRKGVKFHSGDRLTAKDVAFSFERGRAKSPSIKVSLESVERLEIIDDYHFIFYFKTPDVLFIPKCGGDFPIFSKSYHERVGEETFSKQPSGTGPYKMMSYRPGEYIDLERFEEYWGKKPPVKKARIYFIIEDTTRTAKLKAGEADFIQSLPFTEVKEFEKSPNFKVVKLNTNHPTRGIVFASKNPKMPWYDKRVRLAMALAIDCQSIIHNVLLDNAIPMAGLAPGELGYDPEIKPYGYDPKKAKALLAEAGYPNGFDIKLTYPAGGRVSMSEEIVQAVASYFEAVGIRTKLNGMDQNAYTTQSRKSMLDPNAEFIGYFQAGMCGGVDPTNTIGRFFSAPASAVYTNPEVDKIIADARGMINNAKRAELIKKAVKIIHDDVGSVPVFSTIAVYAMKQNINFNPTKKINFDYVLVRDMAVK